MLRESTNLARFDAARSNNVRLNHMTPLTPLEYKCRAPDRFVTGARHGIIDLRPSRRKLSSRERRAN